MSILRRFIQGFVLLAVIFLAATGSSWSSVCFGASSGSGEEPPASAFVKPGEQPLNLISPFSGKQGWARTWGGNTEGSDTAKAIAVSRIGAIYVAGIFYGTVNFNTNQKQKAVSRQTNGTSDVYVCRYDPGGIFKWVRTFGGTGLDAGKGIATDGSGNVYVTGTFMGSVDFDPGTGVVLGASHGGDDVFLSKFNAEGQLSWARTWGAAGDDTGNSVGVDKYGNIAVVGEFTGAPAMPGVDFDPGLGTDLHKGKGETDCFMTKFDPSGNHIAVLVWGGNDNDYCLDVAVDNTGYVYASGGFFSNNLDFSGSPKPEGNTRSPNGGGDAYLCKYDFDGKIQWVRTWGKQGYDGGDGVAVDPTDGAVYVTGMFWLSADLSAGQVPGGVVKVSYGDMDGFVTKFDKNGNFLWVKTIGGEDRDDYIDVAVSSGGFVYVTGIFTDAAELNPEGPSDYRVTAGGVDVVIRQFYPSGDNGWTLTLGGAGRDEVESIAVDPSGGVYISGFFSGKVNFAPKGNYTREAAVKSDAFLVSYPADGVWEYRLSLSGLGGIRESGMKSRGN